MRTIVAMLLGVTSIVAADAPAPRSDVKVRLTACWVVDASERLESPEGIARGISGCKIDRDEVAAIVHEGWNGRHHFAVTKWFRRGSVLAPQVARTCLPNGVNHGPRLEAKVYAIRSPKKLTRLEVQRETRNCPGN